MSLFFCLLLRTGKLFFHLYAVGEPTKKCGAWKNKKINCLLEMGDSQLFIEFDLKFKWGIFFFFCWKQEQQIFKIFGEWNKNFNNICLKKISLFTIYHTCGVAWIFSCIENEFWMQIPEENLNLQIFFLKKSNFIDKIFQSFNFLSKKSDKSA